MTYFFYNKVEIFLKYLYLFIYFDLWKQRSWSKPRGEGLIYGLLTRHARF